MGPEQRLASLDGRIPVPEGQVVDVDGLPGLHEPLVMWVACLSVVEDLQGGGILIVLHDPTSCN